MTRKSRSGGAASSSGTASSSRSSARTSRAPSSGAGSSGAGSSGAGTGGKVAKTQLVERVAEQTSLNRKQAGEAVSAVIECMVAALRGGQRVGLPGLGTLSVTQTAARTGVRPGTSQRIQIPAGKKVAFKIASTLKSQL